VVLHKGRNPEITEIAAACHCNPLKLLKMMWTQRNTMPGKRKITEAEAGVAIANS